MGQTYDKYLDEVEETWNKRIDKDVMVLGQGLRGIVRTLQRGTVSSPHQTETSAFSLSVQVSKLVSAAESLQALTHQLKLWILLSDEGTIKTGQQEELRLVEAEIRVVEEELEKALEEAAGSP